ncbi:hypothetical protein [Streptomyces puniciscabiei]|nr:hypothetical protein [Streptomyces puniciscabiei]
MTPPTLLEALGQAVQEALLETLGVPPDERAVRGHHHALGAFS